VKPYYEDDAVTIYHGDCREVLPGLTFDVVVTDPPYGTGYYATDTDVFTPAMLAALAGLAPVAVFGWPERLAALCVAAGLVPTEWVTWWPTNAAVKAPPSPGLTRESEHVAFFGDWPRFGCLRIARSRPLHEWTGPNQRGTSHGDVVTRLAGDVWTDSAPGVGIHARHGFHPNEKPLAVLCKIIQGSDGGGILDPFMGSGTTLRAAKNLGRRAIGIEVDERYCEIAAKRMGQEVLDLGGVA
jgi:hypothetical protein